MRARSMTHGLLFTLLGATTLVACGDDTTGSGGAGGAGGGTTAAATTGAATATTTTTATTTAAQSTSNGTGGEGTGGQPGSGGAGGGSSLEDLDCEVIIIGGGAAGLHTAFRLGPELGEGVCLFEKEAELGGRIHDVSFDGEPWSEDNPVFGVGARRVMPQQNVLLDLATELELELETPVQTADLVNARGIWATSKEDLLAAYPSITPDVSGDTETFLYEELLFGEPIENVSDYDDFKAYVRESLGHEEFQFLHDASRFRADFEAPLDAVGYMDYLTEEWDVYGDASYPIGGMSAFIRGMEAAAISDGVRIFKGEPVMRIDRDGARYEVLTGEHRVSGDKVVVAVPPVAMQWIDGDVADEIEAQQQFKDIIGVKVAVISQWWDTDWWTQITDADDNQIWRGWTTEHCMNFIEIPLNPYAVDQLVTRSVYDDAANCVELWTTLFEQGGVAAVEQEVQRGLEHLFVDNGVTTPADPGIPSPIKTHVQIWPAAWHWLESGTEFTNTDVYDWAAEPLDGEDVALVGEAYNVNRSGWSDAAYKSSIHLLNTRYGYELEGL